MTWGTTIGLLALLTLHGYSAPYVSRRDVGIQHSLISRLKRQVPSNPVRVESTPSFLGNVTSTNTDAVRDLGYQGKVNNVWVNTFGDTVPCTQTTPQVGCIGLVSSNSAGIMSSTTRYEDIGNIGQSAAQFCPFIEGEARGSGLGITNIIPITKNKSILYTYAINRANLPFSPPGAGIAVVTLEHGVPVCRRPFGCKAFSFQRRR